MSKSLNSPTARMLRSSRLFSLPPPLPQPTVDLVTASGLVRTSDTATLFYPSRQAIAAPASSRHRGDWGLKRPLPEKTNRTSTPHVRVNAMDTLEHITDFDSASDHTQTLAKWQEMDIMMIPEKKPSERETKTGNETAFDGFKDNTAIRDRSTRSAGQPGSKTANAMGLTAERALRMGAVSRNGRLERFTRWKTTGPYLPYMSQTEFDTYVDKVASNPAIAAEFRQFLLQNRRRERRDAALDRMQRESGGFDASNSEDVEKLRTAVEIPNEEEELDRKILELRDTNTELGSGLGKLIRLFFDLPAFPVDLKRAQDPLGEAFESLGTQDPGPPSTHPSAGLSYIRTSAYMDNHPAHGPQLDKRPVQARLMRPRDSTQGNLDRALLGVGGIIADDAQENRGKNMKNNDSQSNVSLGQSFNFEKEGGNKMWVTPTHASVDHTGRIRLAVFNADRDAIAVATNGPDPRSRGVDTETETEFRTRQKMESIPVDPIGGAGSRPGTRENANYGAAMPEYRRVDRAKGFDTQDMQKFKDGMKQRGDRLGDGILDALASAGRRS